MTKEEVIERARARLQQYHPGGVDLDIDESRVHRREGYWYVPVCPSVEPPRTFEYYEALAEVEEALEGEEGIPIQLVPSSPRREQDLVASPSVEHPSSRV